MLKNYIKIAWRSILKNRFFSLLNIFGLAISLAVAILLMTYGQQELSFNKHFPKEANIYRVDMRTTAEHNFETWMQLPNAVGPTMQAEIPDVEATARLVRLNFDGKASARIGNENFLENNVYLTDQSFFQLFDFNFIEGNANSVFSHPGSLVISERKKDKLFADRNAIGEKIILNQRDTFIVTGVYQDLPYNSTFDGEMFGNIMDSWMGKEVYWSNASYETYCLLNSSADVSKIEEKTTALIDKHIEKENQYYTQFLFMPLSKIHLHSSDIRDGASSRQGNIRTVQTVFVLAFLIIAIACINYMNLATARSQNYTKEVGVNKVLGANASHIKLRFYIETAIISLISILLGLLLVCFTFPLFNRLVDVSITMDALLSAQNLMIVAIIWLVITFFGGSYPALYMAKMPSLGLMKKWTTRSHSTENIRRVLVVFQFTCSIILIVGVIVISLQMRHVQEKDLGYDSSQVLSVSVRAIHSQDQFKRIKTSLAALSGTESIATLQSRPGGGESGKSISAIGAHHESLPVRTCASYGSVIPTIGLHLLAGNDLPDVLAPTDTVCYVLVNEVVAAYLGYQDPADAIGQSVRTEMADQSIIVGVVRNFNFNSLRDAIGGYLYYRTNSPSESYNEMLVKYKTDKVNAYLAEIQKIFEKELPDVAFDYQLLDDHIKKQYSNENRTNKVITAFSLLTILVACLGLFGLAAFTAEQRKKEIGVRKVLGASIYQIVYSLAGHFLLLDIISLLIATPIAWWIFSGWLQNFNDKITIPWWSFLVAGLFSTGIALLTTGYQALKAARANPVNSLRDE